MIISNLLDYSRKIGNHPEKEIRKEGKEWMVKDHTFREMAGNGRRIIE